MYKNKKVFITGHTGVMGSWLTAMLIEMGADVVGYSNDVRLHYKLLNIKPKSVTADILNKDKLHEEIYNFNPDIIFHLAAQSLVSVGYDNPYSTFYTNSIGTLNLLESCRLEGFSCPIICVTTDKVYYDTNNYHKESDVLWGSDPYSASKVCAEQVIDTYSKFYLKNISSVRAGNIVCGGEFSKNRILTDIVKAYKNNETLVLRKPNATRPFQHVLDCVYGFLYLGYKMFDDEKFAGSWNFGSESISVIDFVYKISKYMPIKYEIIESNMKESNLLHLDTSKTKELLGYLPLYSIDRSVEITCEWYIKYFCDEIVTFDQTRKYLSERNYGFR